MMESNEKQNLDIPSVNEQVNKLLNSYGLKIHLMAELLSKYYNPFINIRKRFINLTLIKSIIKQITNETNNIKWDEIYDIYLKKERKTKKKISELLTNIRNSNIGIPILTEISKMVYQDIQSIKRYLGLYIIEDVYNSWDETKKELVPEELLKRYTNYYKEHDDKKFEDLAIRLLNKMFFSSSIVNKISEELEYRLFNVESINIKDFDEYITVTTCKQIFFIFMEELDYHTSNPYNFYVASKINEEYSIHETPFRTDLLLSNFIINNCNNDLFSIITFNMNKTVADKIEKNISRNHGYLLEHFYTL